MTTNDDLASFVAVTNDDSVGTDVDLPTGTVTFLLTDVEGSTPMWEADGDAASAAIARHYELLDAAIVLHGGARPLEQGEGDSVVAVFARASDALATALDIQRALADEVWPGEHPLQIRVALHTGEAQHRGERVSGPGGAAEGNYSGPAIIRCARLRSIAHGGQVIVSDAAHDLLVDNPLEGVAWRDLGTHRLKGLERVERVWQLCHPDVVADFPPLRSIDVTPSNLPVELTTFVGREAELLDARDALKRQRLVTLTGSGGCGKTRLALRVAAQEIENSDCGARWIELAPLSDAALVPLAIASGLGHRDDHGRPWSETLPEQLGDRDLLAVLDNCEQVLEPTAAFVAELLQLLPRLRIIATSREPLGIPGEIAWRVPSLDAATSQSLFIERARHARAGFEPDAEELVSIARICTRLDHLPLAIELAAARVRMMQPARIAQALDDRFRLLTGGGRTVMPRQQTLEASVAWSHELLDDQERAVLRRLSVFSGGFTLEAAEAVCADDLVDSYAVLELVTRLVDKSLVQVDDECSRYRLLETIRQYASERLVQSGESADVRDRHLGFFFKLAEECAPTFVTGEGPASLAWLDGEHDNLDAALDWAEASGAQETMLRMVTALALFFELRGHLAEGVHWFARALEADGPESIPRARALWGAAHVALYAHEYGIMLQRAPEALAMAETTGDTWAKARALNTFGYAEVFLDPTRALDTLRRSIALGREIDDPWAIADGLKMLSIALLTQHALDPAGAVGDELRDAAKQLQNLFFRGWYHTGNGFIALFRGELETARREFELALEDCRAVGDPATGSVASSWLAEVDSLAGDHAAAARRLAALNRPASADDFPADEPTVIASATLALRLGDPESALAELEKLAFDEGGFVIAVWASWSAMLRGAAYIALGDDDAAAAALDAARRHAGPPLDNPYLAAAAAYQLGLLARRRGQARESERLHHEALAVRHEHGFLPGLVDSLEALSGLAADGESYREAVRLLGASAAARASHGLARRPVDLVEHDELVALIRDKLGADEFAAALSEGEALTIEDAVAYAGRARSERKRPSSGWDALTPMENQVVALAAEGLTNPQIAERLFVARGTVKIHLSHIFSKLGVSTRAELASAATRRSSEA